MKGIVLTALRCVPIFFAAVRCVDAENILEYRRVSSRDRTNGFIRTLKYLTEVKKLSPEEFDRICLARKWCRTKTYVFYRRSDPESYILGTASIIWERKFSRGGAIKAHVEDVVVHEKYRENGIGKAIMKRIVKECYKNPSCYKILLTCNEKFKGFYQKYGFENNEIAMEHRIKRPSKSARGKRKSG